MQHVDQVKLFKGLESATHELEAEINAWLRDSDVEVVSISGNIAPQTLNLGNTSKDTGRAFAPSDLFIIVQYRKHGG